MKSKIVLPLLFIVLSLGLGSAFIFTSNQRDLTSLEEMMSQIFFSLFGLVASYFLGSYIEKIKSQKDIKLHARAACRRVFSHYKSISTLANTIEQKKSMSKAPKQILEIVEYALYEQLKTVDNSLKDWNDIVPEEVNLIYAEYSDRPQQIGESHD